MTARQSARSHKKESERQQRRKRFSRLGKVLAVVLTAVIIIEILVQLDAAVRQQDVVLSVNGKESRIPEAMVYYYLVTEEFEKIGGYQIFDVSVTGRSTRQTASDRTLQSMVRVKVAQSVAGSLTDAEQDTVRQYTEKLKEKLGSVYMQQYGITDELLEQIVRENYLAEKYESNTQFRTSDFEDEIAQGLTERFGGYLAMDKSQYLRTAVIVPIMLYTGQMSSDGWTSYPDAQKEAILDRAVKIREKVTVQNFRKVAEQVSDDLSVSTNPALSQGAVINPQSVYGNVYYGQTAQPVQEVLNTMEVGDISGVIETDYGYLILMMTGKREAKDKDLEEFTSQLEQARTSYRAELLSDLKSQRMEQEWERLENEAEVDVYPNVLDEYLKSHVNGAS